MRRISMIRSLVTEVCLEICLEMYLSSLIPVHLLTSFFSVMEFLWLIMFCQPATLYLVLFFMSLKTLP